MGVHVCLNWLTKKSHDTNSIREYSWKLGVALENLIDGSKKHINLSVEL